MARNLCAHPRQGSTQSDYGKPSGMSPDEEAQVERNIANRKFRYPGDRKFESTPDHTFEDQPEDIPESEWACFSCTDPKCKGCVQPRGPDGGAVLKPLSNHRQDL